MTSKPSRVARRTVDGIPVPGTVRAATFLDRAVGALTLLNGLAATAVIAVGDGRWAAPAGVDVAYLIVIAVVSLALGVGLLLCAPALRQGERAARRWSVALHLLAAAPALLAPRSRPLSIVFAAVAVAVLVAPSTRRWTELSPADRRAIAAEERQVRRAQRRLAEEAPSLRDIRLMPREGKEPRRP